MKYIVVGNVEGTVPVHLGVFNTLEEANEMKHACLQITKSISVLDIPENDREFFEVNKRCAEMITYLLGLAK